MNDLYRTSDVMVIVNKMVAKQIQIVGAKIRCSR